MKGMRIIKDVRSSDADQKLLFRLGKDATGRYIIIKQKGCRKVYYIPFEMIESAFEE